MIQLGVDETTAELARLAPMLAPEQRHVLLRLARRLALGPPRISEATAGEVINLEAARERRGGAA